jgi:nucleoside-diphosphate-sugar epimerase
MTRNVIFNQLPQSRLLITGATGFVGRALLSHLSSTGCHVIATTRGKAYFGPSIQSVPVGNIGPNTDWSTALKSVGTVIHLAARVHQMRDHHSDPLSAYSAVNTEGTKQLALQAAIAGVKQFIFLSSVKVYGESSNPGQPFNLDSEFRPVDDYGRSKMEAEVALREIEQSYGMNVTVIRSPLVYGPGVAANFGEMIRWISLGWPLPLGGLTKNARSFVAVDNLVNLLATCIDNPKAAGQTFLVSDGQDLSTADLVRRLASAMGKSPNLFVAPFWILKWVARIAGRASALDRLTTSLQVDISHTVNQLGWTPVVSQEMALLRTVAAQRA